MKPLSEKQLREDGEMRIFSTFSGIGGFEIGIEAAFSDRVFGKETNEVLHGGDSPDGSSSMGDGRWTRPICVGYSEIDKYAASVYEYQFGGKCENCRLARKRECNSGTYERQETLNSERTRLSQAVRDNDNTKNERSKDNNECTCPKNFGDITKINADELPDFDCLVGGFPCQAFSIAGKRKGFEDTRGTLFFDLARILRAKQPRLFVFENVKGLLSHDSGRTFKTIIQTIDELGYDCQWQVLNSKNFGVPQNRERIIIVGHLRGTPRPEVFPIEASDGETRLKYGEATIASDREFKFRDIVGTLQARDYKEPKIVAQRGRYNRDGKIEQQLEPRPDDVSNTLTAVQKDNMVLDHVRIRRLTPIECERLQGFPDQWTAEGIDGPISDTQRYKMCGNAVTTNVIQAVFERIFA